MKYWTYTTTYNNLEISYIYDHGISTNKSNQETSSS